MPIIFTPLPGFDRSGVEKPCAKTLCIACQRFFASWSMPKLYSSIIATEPIIDDSGTTTGYVQYGRNVEHVESTVDRLWLFIAAGVFFGTLLASLAGVAIARRR